MTLSERIQAELDRFTETDSFSIVAYYLLEESNRAIKRADNDFKTIASLVKDVDEKVAGLELKVQA